MARVLVGWEKADWQSQDEVNKDIKKYISTAHSFGIKEVVLFDMDNSTDDETGYSAKIIKSIDEIDQAHNYVLLEPSDKIPPNELHNFKNKDVTFVVWSEYGTIPFEKFNNKKYLSVNADNVLWSHVALGIVLHEYYKWQ